LTRSRMWLARVFLGWWKRLWTRIIWFRKKGVLISPVTQRGGIRAKGKVSETFYGIKWEGRNDPNRRGGVLQ